MRPIDRIKRNSKDRISMQKSNNFQLKSILCGSVHWFTWPKQLSVSVIFIYLPFSVSEQVCVCVSACKQINSSTIFFVFSLYRKKRSIPVANLKLSVFFFSFLSAVILSFSIYNNKMGPIMNSKFLFKNEFISFDFRRSLASALLFRTEWATICGDNIGHSHCAGRFMPNLFTVVATDGQ